MKALVKDEKFYLRPGYDYQYLKHLLVPVVIQSYTDIFLQSTSKSLEKALELKILGNAKFGQRQYLEACHLYSHALRYVDKSSYSLLAQLYNNRASTLLHLSLATHAIADVKRALKLDPNYLKAKMALGEALMQLQKYVEAEAALSAALEGGNGADNKRGLALLGKAKQLASFCVREDNQPTSVSPSFPPLRDFVCSPALAVCTFPYLKGRGLVVTTEVPASTVLLTETPWCLRKKDYKDIEIKYSYVCLGQNIDIIFLIIIIVIIIINYHSTDYAIFISFFPLGRACSWPLFTFPDVTSAPDPSSWTPTHISCLLLPAAAVPLPCTAPKFAVMPRGSKAIGWSAAYRMPPGT